MKRLSLFLLVIFVCSYSFAQLTNPALQKKITFPTRETNNQKFEQTAKLKTVATALQKRNQLKKTSKSLDWFDYAGAMQDSLQTVNNLHSNVLFPDTTALIQYSDGLGNPWIHSIGVVLDPGAKIFHNDYDIFNDLFHVDSIEIPCFYNRMIDDPSIVDTLIVEVISNLSYPIFSWTGMTDFYGVDKVSFLDPQYDDNMNYKLPSQTSPTVNTYKILLNVSDTITNKTIGCSIISFATPNSSSDPFLTGITVRFKPGYNWIPNQTIMNNEMNYLLFLSFEEKGNNTFPTYIPDYYNSSYLVTKESFYMPTNSWYTDFHGYYVPSYAWASGFQYENHWISTKLSRTVVGIDNNKSNNNITAISNYPNPVQDNSQILYNLKNSSNVNFTLTDVSGRIINELNLGYQTSGKHNFNVNTSELSNGLYFYSLSVDNNKITNKIIVNR